MNKSNDDYSTVDRISERAHETFDQAAKTAEKAKKMIRNEAADVEARVRDAGHRAKKHSDDIQDSVSSYVQDKPLLSLGIAFAAGMLLSVLRRRR